MKKKDLQQIKEFKKKRSEERLSQEQKLAACDHRIIDGKNSVSVLQSTGNPNEFRCEICDAVIKLGTTMDLNELKDSCDMIMEAIQCVKAALPEKDSEEITVELGKTLLILQQFTGIYKNTVVKKMQQEERRGYNNNDSYNGYPSMNNPMQNNMFLSGNGMNNNLIANTLMGNYNGFNQQQNGGKNKNKGNNKHHNNNNRGNNNKGNNKGRKLF